MTKAGGTRNDSADMLMAGSCQPKSAKGERAFIFGTILGGARLETSRR
jgi:hypothetical protein